MLDTLRANGTVTDWLIHSEVAKDANLFNELPRSNPQEAWSAILKVLDHPESETHLSALSDCLKSLIIHHGVEFIVNIEVQAAQNPRFKTCLAKIHTYTEPLITKRLWERIKNAVGTPVESVTSRERVLEQLPDLSEALYATPIPLNHKDINILTDDDIERIAHNWIKHRNTLWAWKEVKRSINDEISEYAYNVVKSLYEESSLNVHLSSIGEGPLQNLLEKNGEYIIDRIEKLASLDRRFQFCLSYVWPTKIPVDIWKRILKARGDEPQRG